MRKKIIGIVVGIVLVVAIFGILSNHSTRITAPTNNPPVQAPVRVIQPSGIDIPQLFALTNQDRAAAGVHPLVLSTALDSSATDKCNDEVTKNYWAHVSPDGTQPWAFINRYTTFNKAGENLAFNFGSSQAVETGWMNSPEHKVNILDPVFNDVGFGVCKSSNLQGMGAGLIVVEHFTD